MKWKALFIGMGLCCVACHEPTPEEAAKDALMVALEALRGEDYDTYLQHVDIGVPMDSARRAFMKDALRQHQEWKRAERAAIVSVDVVDGRMIGDSICTVYYQYTFADSTCEVASQKMVRLGEEWKLRLRN